jgi:septal ring factor EnvC (AmiA/AmiB activator)
MMYKFLFYFIVSVSFVFAQGSLDNDIRSNRRALDKVKSEITNLKKEITRTNIRSTSTLEQIKIIDKEIGLLGKARRLLIKEAGLLSRKIGLTQAELKDRTDHLTRMKDEHARRAVHNYKYGRLQNVNLLLTASSFNQALVRLKYLTLFSDQEARLMQAIQTEITAISALEDSLQHDLARRKHSIAEKDRQELAYLNKKDEKKLLVSRLQWSQKNLQKQLGAKEEEYQKLYQIILTLEQQRRQREESGTEQSRYALNLKNFSKNKGKLPWPVRGSLLHAYGKQHDSRLKTTINRTGIDIKAKAGSEVKAIFTGIVSMVTYLSGYGNTVILDHGDGYYSVYSHLDEIYAELDQLVDAGQVIGLVGDSGSLEGVKLHFALFSSQRTENPQQWLAKR